MTQEEPIKHAKVTTTTAQDDGTLLIETKSYFEQLSHNMVEVQREKKTSRNTLLSDLVDCVAPILKGSPKITLVLEAKHSEPVKIVYRVVTTKESFNRK